MRRLQKADTQVYACIELNAVEYKAYYAKTHYFGGLAWLIETNKGGQRLYPGTYPPEYCIRHWAAGNPPFVKR